MGYRKHTWGHLRRGWGLIVLLGLHAPSGEVGSRMEKGWKSQACSQLSVAGWLLETEAGGGDWIVSSHISRSSV